MSRQQPVVVLDVGHSELQKGAKSPYPPFTTEWDYNVRIAELIQKEVYRAVAVIIHRDPVPDGYQRLPAKINALGGDFILSLHCNAATPTAFGTEMIYHPGSLQGRAFAQLVQDEVSRLFGWTEGKPGYRGIKEPINGRGSSLLAETIAPCVIAEPFFLSNQHDYQRGIDYQPELASAYARAIDKFAGGFVS